MSTKQRIFVGLFLLLCGIAYFVWKFINKESKDYKDAKPAASYTVSALLNKTASDTGANATLIEQLVVVTGNIKSIQVDSSSTTIELGDTIGMSSIICQIDKRHQLDFADKKENQEVAIKGKITGITIDDELGLGNSIQMNYCTLEKNE